MFEIKDFLKNSLKVKTQTNISHHLQQKKLLTAWKLLSLSILQAETHFLGLQQAAAGCLVQT